MKKAFLSFGVLALINISILVQAQQAKQPQTDLINTKYVIADTKLLKSMAIQPKYQDPNLNVAIAEVSEYQKQSLTHQAHQFKKCGGFTSFASIEEAKAQLISLNKIETKNLQFQSMPFKMLNLPTDGNIVSAVDLVDENNLKTTVQWLSSFPTRVDNSKQPNLHVEQMKTKLEQLAQGAKFPVKIDLVSHNSTNQKSVRVRIDGSERPNEIVVLGGHLDSINQMWWMGSTKAPGADDNASGSANLMEAFRILLQQEQPKRSIEIFWYAAEEQGLLGSDEIAKEYKRLKKDVIAVLQLDMTLFAGSGEFVLGSMTDFTSSWLREYLEQINANYIGAKIAYDKCGYGCSDHASWHNQGYPALMPFEAEFGTMNQDIHTTKDIITAQSNFKHSAMFSKIAVAFAMDLSNSNARQPF